MEFLIVPIIQTTQNIILFRIYSKVIITTSILKIHYKDECVLDIWIQCTKCLGQQAHLCLCETMQGQQKVMTNNSIHVIDITNNQLV